MIAEQFNNFPFPLSAQSFELLLSSEFWILTPEFSLFTLCPMPSAPCSTDMFIRCAEAGRANTIISGDQHLLNLKSYGKVKILNPSHFLKQLQKSV